MSLRYTKISSLDRWGDKSPLRSNIIKKAILNKKDYTIEDFEFKIKYDDPNKNTFGFFDGFEIEVSHFEKIILKIRFTEYIERKYTRVKPKKIVLPEKEKKEEVQTSKVETKKRLDFEVEYFNPQTNVDAQAINHFIAQAKEIIDKDYFYEDKGNVDILNNQYVFKKRPTFYSYPLIWSKGKIAKDNFDSESSYDFATEMYISQIKKVYKPKRLQRKNIKNYMNKVIGRIRKEKILESFDKK